MVLLLCLLLAFMAQGCGDDPASSATGTLAQKRRDYLDERDFGRDADLRNPLFEGAVLDSALWTNGRVCATPSVGECADAP